MNVRAPIRQTRAVILLGVFALLPARPALAVQGSWVTSVFRTEDGASQDTWRSNLDLRSANQFPGEIPITLRVSLSYFRLDSRAGLDSFDGDILRHRYFADLQKSGLRLRSQFVPWQRIDTGAGRSRERLAQVDLNVAPAGGPGLGLHYYRADRQTPLRVDPSSSLGHSWSDDWRADASYAAGPVTTGLGYRRLQTNPSAAALGAGSLMNEWQGNLQTGQTWREVVLQGSYDGTYSTYSSRSRERTFYRQRVGSSSYWSPGRRFTLGGSGLVQWGRTEDNAISGPGILDEKFLSGTADYRPVDGLNLRVLREYREENQSGQRLIADYVRSQVSLLRDLIRGLAFQTGFQNSLDLKSEGGAIPANSAFALVDGRLRQGIAVRGEVRAVRSASHDQTGTQWVRMAQIRSIPVKNTTLDVSWQRNTLPMYQGRAQTDQEWHYLVGYNPLPGSNLVASFRHLAGRGRLTRQERYGSFTGGMRLSDRTTLSLDWSRRESLVVSSRTGEIAFGLDLSLWLPDEIRTKLSWRRIVRREFLAPYDYGAGSNTYGLILDKSF